MMESEQQCRICFAGAGEPEGALISPCRCQGSQKCVHLSCLRRWQRCVQLDGSNHPEDSEKEDRHRICNVCKSPFNVPPEDRAEMMCSLAQVKAEDIAPGLLLVTTRCVADSNPQSAQLPLLLRAYIEARTAHFRECVYILTEVAGEQSADGSDSVIGVNITRAMDEPNLSSMHDVASRATIQACQSRGVRLQWMNGGPVSPSTVYAMCCLQRLPADTRAAACRRHGAAEIVRGQVSVAWGSMKSVLGVASEEAAGSSSASSSTAGPTVLVWSGFAKWSRTQLLGEMARGSWGWCDGSGADVLEAISALRPSGGSALWAQMRPSARLRWAPENELSREWNSRHGPQATAPADRNADEQQEDDETVGELARDFEARARAREASRRAREQRTSASAGGRQRRCLQQ